MDLLSAAQAAAIRAGQPVYQTWLLGVPRDATYAVFDEVVIEQHAQHPHTNRVTNPGSREFLAIGINAMDTRSPIAAEYEFEVRNDDGMFYRRAGGSIFDNPVTSFAAQPQACYVVHKVFILLLDGTLSEFDFCSYVGWIKDVDYTDGASAAAGPKGNLAVVRTEDAAAYDVLRREWNKHDGETTYTGWDVTW